MEPDVASGLRGAADSRAEPVVAFPCSFAQERLWFLDQLAPRSVAYNLTVQLRLGRSVDAGALEAALGEVVRRHESLRTSFHAAGGRAVQVVHPVVPVPLEVLDLPRAAQAGRLLEERARAPFDLTVAPLLRALLVRPEDAAPALALTMHHIVTDAWSMGVLEHELRILHAAFVAGRPSPLPQPELQYADFAVWQRRRLSGPLRERQLAYWRRQLAGAPVLLELSTDRPRPAVQSFDGARQERWLSPALSEAIGALARQQDATVFMTLLSAFAALLQRLSGQSDVPIGTPIANRTRTELERLIGFFVNTLVLRCDVSGDPSFGALLARVSETATGAYTRQDLPFEALVQELAPERHLAYSPLFQVMFNFVGGRDAPGATERSGDRSPRRDYPKFDLSLYAAACRGRLHLSMVYRTDLFEHDTVGRMLDDLEALLERAAADPDAPVSRLAAAAARPSAPRPRRRHPAADIEQAIPARFARQVQRGAERLAVVTDAHAWTYRELSGAVGAIARGLPAGPSRTGLLLEPGAPMLAGVLGALAARRAYVPLDPRDPPQRLTWLVADAGASELLAEPATLALAERVARARGLSVRAIEPAAPVDLPPTTGAPGDLAYLLYTSGSTGQPKAVMQNHRNVLHFARTYAARLGLGPEDRMSLLASYAFDAAAMDIFGALTSGACLCPFDVRSEGVQALPAWLARRRITVLHATPTLFRALMAMLPGDADLTSVRAVVLGGEAAYRSDAELVGERFRPGCVLVNGFGPTECSIALQHVVDSRTPLRRTALPLGHPIEGIEVELLDGAGQPVAGEGVGEIALRSPHTALGYHGRPEETDTAFQNAGDGVRVYRTGDLARRLRDGTLEFVGRRDAQVKVRGYRVEVGEIELRLRAIDGIDAAAVVVREDLLVAYLVAAPATELSVAAIRSRLRRELPDYLVPSQLVLLDRLPLTHSGKLDHHALPAPVRPSTDGATAPRSRTEQLLAGMWEEVLGDGRVGVDQSFFDVGGHSLLATQVVSRIRDAFGVELSLRAFFEGPTIAQLARRLGDNGDARSATDAIRPRAGGGPCPLSFAQQRLWFLDQFAPGSAAYNLSVPYGVGVADPSTLERVVREIVRRHEVLRTTFDAVGGRPVQVVRPDVRLPFETVDAPGIGEARRLAQAEARLPFDLRAGPLIRALLIRRGEGRDMLVLTMHHIVSDGWSMDVIDRELRVLCAAFEAGRESPLPALPIQYADFAAWQRQRLSGQLLERELDYWRERLGGAPGQLELSIDRPRPTGHSFDGEDAELEFSPALGEALRTLARRENVTLFMLLLSAFAALLHRLSGQDDVLVGTPIANRTLTELEGLVGFFVNTLVLRCDVSGDPSFRTLLGRVRDTATGAYAHQDLPFEALVRELAPERNLTHNPLFGVMFVLRQGTGAPAGDGVLGDTATAKFDLTLAVDDDGRRMVATLEYRRDLFDRPTIERLLGQLHTLLEDVVIDANRRVSELALLKPAQRRAVLALGRGPGVAVPAGTVADRFEQRAASTPGALALIAGDTRLRFAELNRRANRVAAGLRAAGVGAGALVALCAELGVDRVAGVLGALKAGAAYLPLDPAHPTSRLRATVRAAGPAAVIATAGVRARHALPGPTLELEGLCGAPDAPDPARASGADDLAYVIYTSGSTGAPNGVAIEHHALSSHVAAMRACYELRPDDRVLQLAPLSFDVAAEEMFPTWCAGGAVVLAPEAARGSLDTLMRCLADYRVTVVNLPAAYWHEWVAYLERGRLRPPAVLRLVIAGSEAVRPDRLAQWRRLAGNGCRWLNAYGTTETTITSTVFEPPPEWADAGVASVPVGWAVGNARVVVVDAAGRPVPVGVTGELVIGGDGLARGYVGRPELTAERFVELPELGRVYRTGDLARLDERGCVQLLGRRDDQIKIRGYRVEPAELQAALERCPGVHHAVALAHTQHDHTRLIAYIVPSPGHNPDPGRLRAQLRGELPDYLIPAAIITLEALPLGPNGKLDRAALPGPDHQRPELAHPYTPPQSPTEQQLAAIWQDILELDHIGRHDNFFELGGDSILSLQVAARAHQAGLGIAVADVFRHQTIAELAAAAGTVPPAAPDGPFTGSAPLTPVQHWFFEHVTEDVHHDNQAMLLAVDAAVDGALLRPALAELVRRHGALRLRFTRTSAGWEQTVAPADGELSLLSVDLSSLPDGERPAHLERRASAVQSGLELTHGPIARFAHFAMGPEERDRLLIVIHHLAVDGVSWRILLDDLETALDQLRHGHGVALAPPTTSPLRWAERLVAHARTPALLDEAGRWPAWANAPLAALPVDLPDGRAAATVASERTLTAALGPDETSALLRGVPLAFDSRTEDVLLAALTRAVTGWTGEDAMRVALEAHGREPIADDINISGTVGWFTTIFPLVLRVDRAAPWAEALAAVGAQLRSVPRRGIGFGLLRYVVRDGRMAAIPEPEIAFNYLGQFTGGTRGRALLTSAPESPGPARSGRQVRPHVFEVSAWVTRGRMRLAWSFSEALHDPATAQALLDGWVAELYSAIRAAGAAPAGDEHEAYALSPLQQGMLFHTMLAPHAGEYVGQAIWEPGADLDAAAYRRAWQAAVTRHAVLRTGFPWRGATEPCQVVRARARLPWREHDWRGLEPGERADRLERLLDEDRRRGFELERPPLLRLALIRWCDDAVKVVWSHHHLVLDGWSVQLLLAEVNALYRAFRRNEVPQLSPPRPYRDFIEWLDRRERTDDERWWREALRGFSAPTPLLPERSEPSAERSSDEARTMNDGHEALELVLDDQLSAQVDRFGRANRVTLSTIVRAAWAILLNRYSGERDILFGATVAGRPADLAGADSIIGLFINTLPVRVEVADEEPVAAWMQRLQAQHAELREREHCSLADVQRWSDVDPGLPLFESLLVVENYPRARAARGPDEQPGLRRRRALETASYPFALVVRPGGCIALKAIYRPARFDEPTVARALGHLGAILEAATGDPEQGVGDLPLLTPAERRRLLVEHNDTAFPYPERSLHALFEEQVDRTRDAVAIMFGADRLTYSEVDRRANRLANHLLALGVKREERVGIFLERSLEAVVAALGIVKAGGAYVPLDPSHPPDRLAFMLEDASVGIVVTDGERALERGARLVRFGDPAWDVRGRGEERPAPASDADSLAYVMYTSGSTGRPKGVMVVQRAVVRLVQNTNYVTFGRDDRVALASNFAFDAATLEVWGALLNGARLIGVPREVALNPAGLATHLREHRISVLFLTTSLFHQVADHVPSAFASVRHVMIGGEPADRRRVRAVLAADPPELLMNCYGPTETTTFATFFPIEEIPAEGAASVPVGWAVGNARVVVVDAAGRPVPVGVTGELVIGGDGLARGYVGRPELTAERFVELPELGRVYRTGDLARLDERGCVQLLGRRDDQIKIRGYRVEPAELQAALERCPGVHHAVALAHTQHDHTRLIAYIVPSPGHNPDPGRLRAQLRGELPDYLIPAAIITLEALPLGPNGKLDRAALPGPDHQRPELAHPYTPPQSPTEQQLAAIWQDILELDHIGRHDNFFELGGHSLLATQVVSRIRDASAAEVSLHAFFAGPTIAQLAAAVTAAEGTPSTDHDPPLTAAPRAGFAAALDADGRLRLPPELRDRLAELVA